MSSIPATKLRRIAGLAGLVLTLAVPAPALAAKHSDDGGKALSDAEIASLTCGHLGDSCAVPAPKASSKKAHAARARTRAKARAKTRSKVRAHI